MNPQQLAILDRTGLQKDGLGKHGNELTKRLQANISPIR